MKDIFMEVYEEMMIDEVLNNVMKKKEWNDTKKIINVK